MRDDVAAELAAAEKWEVFAGDKSGGRCVGSERRNRRAIASYYCLHFVFLYSNRKTKKN